MNKGKLEIGPEDSWQITGSRYGPEMKILLVAGGVASHESGGEYKVGICEDPPGPSPGQKG